MKPLLTLLTMMVCAAPYAQNVGIGTATPNAASILDISSTNRVLLIPRMNNTQMNAIANPPAGSLIFNTQRQQFMGYVQTRASTGTIGGNPITVGVFEWLPVATGPRVLAWGRVDTTSGVNEFDPGGIELRGNSGNFDIDWDNDFLRRRYVLSLKNNVPIDPNNMLLVITPIGIGSWDLVPSVQFTPPEEGTIKALIKFTDVTRLIMGADSNFSLRWERRKSNFVFVLYDLRTAPVF